MAIFLLAGYSLPGESFRELQVRKALSMAETRVLLTRDAGYNPYRVMFTARDFLQQHPDVVAKFVRASIKGWREYLKDPTTAHQPLRN